MRITVYCGSSQRVGEPYIALADDLGRAIAEAGHELIYGGARVGLMGRVANAALEAGGAVRGIILKDFIERGDVHHPDIELETVDDMRLRKAGLDGNADAFIALPGGMGTFEELTEILSFRQLGLHHRPIVLVNVAGYWDPFLAQLDRAIADGFMKERDRSLFAVTEDPREAVQLCEQQMKQQCEEGGA